MVATPKPPRQLSIVAIRKELEYLYSRRLAVEELIRSLEDYDQTRDRRISCGKLKSA